MAAALLIQIVQVISLLTALRQETVLAIVRKKHLASVADVNFARPHLASDIESSGTGSDSSDDEVDLLASTASTLASVPASASAPPQYLAETSPTTSANASARMKDDR